MSNDTVNLGTPPEAADPTPRKPRAPRSTAKPAAREYLEMPADAADANVTQASKFPKIRVIFNESNLPSDLNEAFISVNGRGYQFQRGVEVSLPPEVLEAADHAIIDQVRQRKDGTLYMVPTKRYPYQIQDSEGHRVMEAWKKFHEDRRQAA